MKNQKRVAGREETSANRKVSLSWSSILKTKSSKGFTSHKRTKKGVGPIKKHPHKTSFARIAKRPGNGCPLSLRDHYWGVFPKKEGGWEGGGERERRKNLAFHVDRL